MEMINAIGRRKASVARVYLSKGEGKVTVNGKDYKTYFPQVHIQHNITDPFTTIETADIFDVNVNVHGGGFKGQSGQTDQTGIIWFSNTAIGCDVPSKVLYCVQQ